MPLYDYKCNECGHIFEKTHKISQMEDVHPCENCESPNTERIITKSASIGDPVRLGFIKPPSDFQDVLKNIHKKTHGSKLNKSSTIVDVK